VPKERPSHAETNSALESAPEKASNGQGPFLLLVFVFVAVFVFATVLQVRAHRDEAVRRIVEADFIQANAVADRVNSSLAAALGAATVVSDVARAGLTASDVARAAAQPTIVRSAAVLNLDGEILATTNAEDGDLARAALNAAGEANAWTGAPERGDVASAPVVVRRGHGYAVISILETEAVIPALSPEARVLIAAPSGAVLYASPALRDDERARSRILAAANARTLDRAIFLDGQGHGWAVASAALDLGAYRVVVAGPAPTPVALWTSAVARYALIAAAPLAAIAVLFLLMRQSARRARLAEADAQRAENNFRLAADGAKAGVMEWRPDLDQVQLSEQAARLLGSAKDTITLEDLIGLIAVDDRFNVEEEFRRARHSGMLDARFRVARGASLGWIEARGAGVEDSTGPMRLFCTIIDATSRHEAEARVSRMERQLRAAIESYSGPFALWDTRRRLVLWNQSFASSFDLGPELLRPRASYEAIAAAAAARIRRDKHDANDPDVRVIELATGDWLQIVERRTNDGGLVTVGHDITALKRKEEELAKNERRLKEAVARMESQEYKIKALAREAHEERQKAEDASRAKSAFLANMSHELRTPLNAVIGFSEIMANQLFGPIGNDQYKQYSSDIFDSGNHLLDLINDILDMAKIEAGKLTLAPRPLDPAVVIDQAVRLTKRRADEKGLSVVVDAEELPEIEADHRAVKQMLLNLLSNAVKFTDEGAIMVRARANATGLSLAVADTGCGIPPEHLPRLAQPFQQVEQELARNHSGTGLGLALTKSLAEMHGGKLSIQSEVGKGTIVTITLPRVFGGARGVDATAAE